MAENAQIIENYPEDKYTPSCLILGFTKLNRPLHLQVSYAETDMVRICIGQVTVGQNSSFPIIARFVQTAGAVLDEEITSMLSLRRSVLSATEAISSRIGKANYVISSRPGTCGVGGVAISGLAGRLPRSLESARSQ